MIRILIPGVVAFVLLGCETSPVDLSDGAEPWVVHAGAVAASLEREIDRNGNGLVCRTDIPARRGPVIVLPPNEDRPSHIYIDDVNGKCPPGWNLCAWISGSVLSCAIEAVAP